MREFIIPWSISDDESDCDICKYCDSLPSDEPCQNCTSENCKFEFGFTELIRCKDCKHYTWMESTKSYYCKNVGWFWEPDGYCSRAERREDERRQL